MMHVAVALAGIALASGAATLRDGGDACTQYDAQSACDANSTCTWCKCAAVPSSCYSKADAKGLPPGVFTCDTMSAVDANPISTVPVAIGSFCDHNFDYVVGAPGNNFSYSACIDIPNAMWKTVGLGPPGSNVTSIYRNQTSYTVQDGACKVAKVGPSGDPPNAIPFSFLLIDNDGRGAASYVGNTTIDGLAVEHWSHLRAPIGTMNWFVKRVASEVNVQLVRNSFSPTAGGAGVRDFSKSWATPASPDEFAIPAECNNVVPVVVPASAAAAVFPKYEFGEW